MSTAPASRRGGYQHHPPTAAAIALPDRPRLRRFVINLLALSIALYAPSCSCSAWRAAPVHAPGPSRRLTPPPPEPDSRRAP
jgi:hypothetical protein